MTARLVVVLPALAAVVGLLVPRGARRPAAAVAVVGAAGALVAALAELVAGGVTTGITLLGPVPTGAGAVSLDLRADRLSAVVAVMVGVVAMCVQVYSTAYQHHDPRYRAYAATVSLFTAAMLLVVQADDLLLLLVGWEVMGLCSYLLVGHDSQREAARRAAVKAFLTTRVGDVGFVLGIVVLLAGAGTTSITVLLQAETLAALSPATRTAAVLLLVAGVVGKSAQFPLHTWLPDAMEGPTPVSALIHAATMVAAGGYVLARLLPLVATATPARATLAVVASVSMLGAALAALAQDDLKRVLAWSTISQVAYLLAAIAVTPADLGSAPSVLHLLSHAGFKALLFLAAGALAHQVHTTSLAGLAGSWRRAPLVTVVFTIGLASLAGLPPLSGFWSKEAVLGAAEEAGGWTGHLVLVVGLVTGLVTAVYATRTWLLVVLGSRELGADGGDGAVDVPAELAVVSADGGAERAADGDLRPPEVGVSGPVAVEVVEPVPVAMLVPLVLLAVPASLGGLLLLGPVVPGAVHLSAVTGGLAAGLSLIGVVATALVARARPDPALALAPRLRGAMATGFGVDAATRAVVVRPVRALARLVAAGDRDVVDAYVRGAAASARGAGWALRRTQTGGTTGYLTWVAVGAVVVAVAGVGLR